MLTLARDAEDSLRETKTNTRTRRDRDPWEGIQRDQIWGRQGRGESCGVCERKRYLIEGHSEEGEVELGHT